MNDSLRIRSFAKINLALAALGRRPDGFHNIETVFQAIDISDELDFRPSAEISLVCEGLPDVSERDNIVWKAAALLAEHTGERRGVAVTLRKKIPSGAGLGGGSGNMWEKFDIWDSRALTETVIPEDWFIAPDVSELEAGRDGIIVIEPDRRIAGGRAGPGIGADAASNARQVFAQNRMQVRTGAGAPGASRDGGRRRHEGRDLNVSAGTPIASFFDGTVHRVYGAGGQGGLTFVEIRNNDGTLAVYGYVQPNLRAGQPVSAGQVFGTVQDLRRNPRYRDTPNHVHFELWTGGARRQGNFIDIASLL
jgi:hypothetical protein